MFKKIIQRVTDRTTPSTYLSDDVRVFAAEDDPETKVIVTEDMEARITRRRKPGWSWITPSIKKGAIAVALFIVVVLSYQQEWWLIKRLALLLFTWATEWAPAHPKYAVAIVAFLVLSLLINFFAHQFGRSRHTVGRAKLWLSISVFEFVIWFFFWYWPLIVTPRNVLGRGTEPMPIHDILLSDLIIIFVASITFWALEKMEDYRRYLHQTSA